MTKERPKENTNFNLYMQLIKNSLRSKDNELFTNNQPVKHKVHHHIVTTAPPPPTLAMVHGQYTYPLATGAHRYPNGLTSHST